MSCFKRECIFVIHALAATAANGALWILSAPSSTAAKWQQRLTCQRGFRFHDLVTAVVQSEAFQYKTKGPAQTSEAGAKIPEVASIGGS